MTLVFAAFDYNARSGQVTVITPSGRTVSPRAELLRRSETWRSLKQDPHALYRDFTRLFLAWLDIVDPAFADAKLVISGTDIVAALIYDGVIHTISLGKQPGFHTANMDMLDGIRAIAGFLPDDAIDQAGAIFSELAGLAEAQTVLVRH